MQKLASVYITAVTVSTQPFYKIKIRTTSTYFYKHFLSKL